MKRTSKRDIVVERFYKYLLKDSAKARQIIKQADYKADALLLKCIALTYKDEAMFDKGKIRKVFIKRKIELATKYIDKSFTLNPDCRDILYLRGIIYNADGDTHTAIDCYIKIMELGEDAGEDANCSNSGLPYIRMVLNDARFQLYRLFDDLKSYDLSIRFLKAYKEHLKKGVDSLYKPLEKFLMDPSHSKIT